MVEWFVCMLHDSFFSFFQIELIIRVFLNRSSISSYANTGLFVPQPLKESE